MTRAHPAFPRLAATAALLACLFLCSACIGIASRDLLSIGTGVTSAKVDFADLYGYAGRAKAAYGPEDAIRSKYPFTRLVNTPGKTDVRYFLEQDDTARTQHITIRGTASKIDIRDDVEIRIRADRQTGIPVHTGFDTSTRDIHADVTPHLKRGYKTYIAGHSLGGAIAALLAVYLIEDGHDVVRVVTFGQPKFTTAAGVQKLGFLPITRVVDENDIVPMLPPTTIITKAHGSYEHVGSEIILLEGPNYAVLASHDATRLSVGEFMRSLRIADFADHKMDHYLSRLAPKTGGAVEVPFADRERYVAPKEDKRAKN